MNVFLILLYKRKEVSMGIDKKVELSFVGVEDVRPLISVMALL